jgi:flagellin
MSAASTATAFAAIGTSLVVNDQAVSVTDSANYNRNSAGAIAAGVTAAGINGVSASVTTQATYDLGAIVATEDLTAGELTINGVQIVSNINGLTDAARAGQLRDAINTAMSGAGRTDLAASLSGDNVVLTASSGSNIQLETDGNGAAALGTFDISGAAASLVRGGQVTFSSTGNLTVDALAAGTYGAGITAIDDGTTAVAASSATTTMNLVSVATRSDSETAIASIDLALEDVDTIRGGLGAVQNRFESTIANLQNVSENLSSARSRILDADIAQETSSMTKQNILQQAGVSILAQANQAPQLALSLLR